MARIRTIKPEFPEDELLGSEPIQVRYLFILLWTIADDEGRFRAAPEHIKSKLFQYDYDLTVADVAQWLKTLDKIGRVHLYVVRNQQYGEIVNWLKHQRIDRPSPSSLPPSPERSTNETGTLVEHSTRRGREKEGKGEDLEGEREGPVSVDLQLPVFRPEGAGSLSTTAACYLLRSAWPAGRQGSERKALAAWKKALTIATEQQIGEGASAWLAYWKQGDNALFAHEFANWLNDERWREPPPPIRKGKGEDRQQRIAAHLQAFIERGETA